MGFDVSKKVTAIRLSLLEAALICPLRVYLTCSCDHAVIQITSRVKPRQGKGVFMRSGSEKGLVPTKIKKTDEEICISIGCLGTLAKNRTWI